MIVKKSLKKSCNLTYYYYHTCCCWCPATTHCQVPCFKRARLVFSLLLLVLLVLLLPLNLTPFAEMLPARSPLTGATSGVRACECIFAHEPLRQGPVPPRVVCLVQRPVLYERLHERTTSQRSSIKYNASPYKRQAGSWDRAIMQIPTSNGSSLHR